MITQTKTITKVHCGYTFMQVIHLANQSTTQGFNSILQKRVRQARIAKRISSHLFRHKEITDLANKLTESESRMRHGWGKNISNAIKVHSPQSR